MQIVITIDEKDYNDIMTDSPRNLNHYERLIVNGIPLPNDERSKTCTKCVSFSNTCRICRNKDMYKEQEHGT